MCLCFRGLNGPWWRCDDGVEGSGAVVALQFRLERDGVRLNHHRASQFFD
jgi:hypothetical protein